MHSESSSEIVESCFRRKRNDDGRVSFVSRREGAPLNTVGETRTHLKRERAVWRSPIRQVAMARLNMIRPKVLWIGRRAARNLEVA